MCAGSLRAIPRKAVYGGYVTLNFLYPTLFICVAMMCFATWFIAARVRKHYRPLQVEMTAQMPSAEAMTDDITDVEGHYYSYSASQKEWSNNDGDTVPEAPETPSPPSYRLCPRCGSEHVEKRNQARKAGSTIGAVAGATSGVAMTLSGAEVGATVGLIAGPIGSVFGGLAGAILAGLAASAAGCAAGAAMGEVIDENVLDNHRCVSCGHTFNASA